MQDRPHAATTCLARHFSDMWCHHAHLAVATRRPGLKVEAGGCYDGCCTRCTCLFPPGLMIIFRPVSR